MLYEVITIFEIEDNILVVRDYVPLRESLDYEQKVKFTPGKNRFEFLDKRSKSITIDFKSASNLIIIPVIINESDTLNFILDTGVRFPIITELPFVDKLNLNYMRPVEISGLGEGESLTAYRSRITSYNVCYTKLLRISGLGEGESLTAYRSGNNTMKIGSGLIFV